MKAIRVHAPGGPEALRYEDVAQPSPAAGQVLVKVEAAGVNYIDVYQRNGLYKVATPFTLGQEAAGVVSAVGAGVTDPKVGDRVVYASILGAYAEYAVVPADRVVVLPEGVTTRQAAAVMVQGMTAHYLACTTYPLKTGDTCLVHAAAGGVPRAGGGERGSGAKAGHLKAGDRAGVPPAGARRGPSRAESTKGAGKTLAVPRRGGEGWWGGGGGRDRRSCSTWTARWWTA